MRESGWGDKNLTRHRILTFSLSDFFALIFKVVHNQSALLRDKEAKGVNIIEKWRTFFSHKPVQ